MNNQTSWIAASLFIGFVVFVTIKGELPAYKAAILGGQAGAVAATASAIGTSSTAGPSAAVNTLLGQGGG